MTEHAIISSDRSSYSDVVLLIYIYRSTEHSYVEQAVEVGGEMVKGVLQEIKVKRGAGEETKNGN